MYLSIAKDPENQYVMSNLPLKLSPLKVWGVSDPSPLPAWNLLLVECPSLLVLFCVVKGPPKQTSAWKFPPPAV
ncbi:hypothetical protein F2Q70_00029132 [Brassica cretica]|uniref:Uncharacterized protein n=1 Tax=Brassica cretica TaxID=69181 RepID=A0A3N6R4H7_BRACR|nr:hypothetical protein F2Q70_00029132 [Brassica cretica]KAF3591117.1 hypothetical protein DY000_02020312 [Brassica cretica]